MDFDSSDVSWRSVISLLPRQREGEVGQRERERGEGEREREREDSNSNSKTLFYKDCRLGSVKNLTTSPC